MSQKVKRISLAALTLVVALMSIAGSVSAAVSVLNPYYYGNLIQLTENFAYYSWKSTPSEFDAYWNFYKSDWTKVDTLNGAGGTTSYTFQEGTEYITKFYPFGADNYRLDISKIPNGSYFAISGNANMGIGLSTPAPGLVINYYDANFNSLKVEYIMEDVGDYDNEWFDVGTYLNYPEGTKYIRPDLIWRDWSPLEDKKWTVSVSYYYIEWMIPKTQYDTDAGLDTNQSIQNAKPGVDNSINDLNNLDKPNIENSIVKPGDVAGDQGSQAASNMLGTIAALPIVNAQLVAVIGLMIVAYVLHGKKG